MSLTVFTSIDNFITEYLNKFSSTIQTLMQAEVKAVLLSGIALYIIIFGYMILAGKIQMPVQDLLWRLCS